MALILTFPPESGLTTSELVAMISAVLDEPAKNLSPYTRNPHRLVYGWQYGHQGSTFGYSTLLIAYETGAFGTQLRWGKLSEVYEPALSWGAIQKEKRDA